MHAYTFRDENEFLPACCRTGGGIGTKGDAFGEYRAFFDAGVDGVFSDRVDTSLVAREDWLADRTAVGEPALL